MIELLRMKAGNRMKKIAAGDGQGQKFINDYGQKIRHLTEADN